MAHGWRSFHRGPEASRKILSLPKNSQEAAESKEIQREKLAFDHLFNRQLLDFCMNQVQCKMLGEMGRDDDDDAGDDGG